MSDISNNSKFDLSTIGTKNLSKTKDDYRIYRNRINTKFKK